MRKVAFALLLSSSIFAADNNQTKLIEGQIDLLQSQYAVIVKQRGMRVFNDAQQDIVYKKRLSALRDLLKKAKK